MQVSIVPFMCVYFQTGVTGRCAKLFSMFCQTRTHIQRGEQVFRVALLFFFLGRPTTHYSWVRKWGTATLNAFAYTHRNLRLF